MLSRGKLPRNENATCIPLTPVSGRSCGRDVTSRRKPHLFRRTNKRDSYIPQALNLTVWEAEIRPKYPGTFCGRLPKFLPADVCHAVILVAPWVCRRTPWGFVTSTDAKSSIRLWVRGAVFEEKPTAASLHVVTLQEIILRDILPNYSFILKSNNGKTHGCDREAGRGVMVTLRHELVAGGRPDRQSLWRAQFIMQLNRPLIWPVRRVSQGHMDLSVLRRN